MSKGHIFLSQNSDVDYLRQAYALALSIKKFNKINQTCLITNNPVPDEYRYAFDYVVPIPWSDLAAKSTWKIENRWKIIHCTPFKENIVYDVDMLLLNSNDHWWKHFKNRDLVFTNNVFTYRGQQITSKFYRKTFKESKLPNVYTGCFYFRKTQPAYEFFKWVELITKNYELFYKKFLTHPQKFFSFDVSAALALRFMNKENEFVGSLNVPSFTHMKPMIQEWKHPPNKWTDVLSVSFNDNCDLKISNIKQNGIFHYVEDEFLTEEIIHKLLK
jgi:hypothetical protein